MHGITIVRNCSLIPFGFTQRKLNVCLWHLALQFSVVVAAPVQFAGSADDETRTSDTAIELEGYEHRFRALGTQIVLTVSRPRTSTNWKRPLRKLSGELITWNPFCRITFQVVRPVSLLKTAFDLPHLLLTNFGRSCPRRISGGRRQWSL